MTTKNQLARLTLATAFALLFVCILLIAFNIETRYILYGITAYGATVFVVALVDLRGWDKPN